MAARLRTALKCSAAEVVKLGTDDGLSETDLGSPSGDAASGLPDAAGARADDSEGRIKGRRRRRRRGRRRAATEASPTDQTPEHRPAAATHKAEHTDRRVPGAARAYAALDLGTNNCRLLVAVPGDRGFQVIDSFSRIVRLGEGVGHAGKLSDAAMNRAIGALKVCAGKLNRREIRAARLIATEACRLAENGEIFLSRVRSETGLNLEIVTQETEARLAAAGCGSLIDRSAAGAILFDIGGGSSELVWLDLRNGRSSRPSSETIRSWQSLPVGVVTLSERHGGRHVDADLFEAMVAEVAVMLDRFPDVSALDESVAAGGVHMIGTSGTVTTLAGIHLGLERYDRSRVDGLWMSDIEIGAMIDELRDASYETRVANPCIGRDRADLVLAGCAILEAFRRRWHCPRMRVADRGLREGILVELMRADGVWRRSGRNSQRPAVTGTATDGHG
ncbi:MAG: Ppx/GppA phosphatase family protein [Alphaproteobacteria bacterium]